MNKGRYYLHFSTYVIETERLGNLAEIIGLGTQTDLPPESKLLTMKQDTSLLIKVSQPAGTKTSYPSPDTAQS